MRFIPLETFEGELTIVRRSRYVAGQSYRVTPDMQEQIARWHAEGKIRIEKAQPGAAGDRMSAEVKTT